jgi:hypothetical protein
MRHKRLSQPDNAFQHALKERDVPMYSEQMLEDELASLKSFFGA